MTNWQWGKALSWVLFKPVTHSELISEVIVNKVEYKLRSFTATCTVKFVSRR